MRILVVEDEKKIAALVSRILTDEGFSVDVIHRGDEAWSALQERPYDLAVLDIMLPGLDGLTILGRLRAAPNSIPVLMLTARGATSERVEGLNTGADDYLAKPFAVEELSAV